MARKASLVGGQRPRGSSGGSDSSGSEAGPSLSKPLTYLVTPLEAYRVQSALSKAGLAKAPQGDIDPSFTNPPTPIPSYPSTPVSGLPPKNSPFTPFSSIPVEESAHPTDAKPTLHTALKNVFHDDVLPLSTRTALRAFVLGWFVNYTFQTVIPTVMRRRR